MRCPPEESVRYSEHSMTWNADDRPGTAIYGSPAAPNRVRVVLAEDDLLLREGLASLLERSDFDVVGQAGDGGQLLAIVRDTKPDLVVTDIRMPPSNFIEGIDAASIIRRELPETAVVVLSAYVDTEHALALLASGRGIGYLLKSRITDVAGFVDTLHRVAGGATAVDPGLVQELMSVRRRADRLAALSAREREVLSLMARGSIECRYRPKHLDRRKHGPKARAQYPVQAEPARGRRRSPASARGDCLSGGAMMRFPR